MKRHVVILGAGVCGLAAAERLLAAGKNAPRVTLLECEPEPGGLARSVSVNGQVADLGPHRIFTELPDVQAFLKDLAGLDLVTVRRESTMFLQRTWITYPPKPLEILALLGPVKLASSVVSWFLTRNRPQGEHATFEDVMVRAFGRELYDFLIGPYTAKVWKADPAKLHGDIARVRVSAGGFDRMLRKALGTKEKEGEITAVQRFYYLPGGVESLVRKLRTRIEGAGAQLRTRATVTAIAAETGGRHRITLCDADGRTEHLDADAVISTIPLTDLLAMLLPHVPDEAVTMHRARVRFLHNTLVCVVVNRPRVSGAQWIYFPSGDTIFNRAFEPKNFHRSMGPQGEAMLVVECTGHSGDAVDSMPAELLAARVREDLVKTGLVRDDEIIATHVHRIPNTYPVYDLEYRERLDALMEYLKAFPRIVSTGRQGLLLHNNMDHSMHMGFRAANAVRDHPDAPAPVHYGEVPRFRTFRIVD